MADDDWDPLDHTTMRNRIEEGTIEEWGRVLPAEYGGIRLEAKNLRFAGKPHYTLKDQKKAWLENRELGRSLKADLELYDRETGDLLDAQPAITLMKVPHYTDRGTFVYNGNNFSASHQARLMPGVYTRRQANGGLESQFNTRTGTGRVFRVGIDQDTGQFRLKIAGSNLHLYSVLKDSGVSDDELAQTWGPEILEINRSKYDPRSITKAFQKFVPKYVQPQAVDDTDRGALLLDALNKAQVSKAVTDRTLAAYWKPRDMEKAGSQEIRNLLRLFFPQKTAAAAPVNFDVRSQMGDTDDEGDEYRPVGLDGLLASTRKLLAVNRGLDQTDDRSIPTYTKIYTMDKLMRERIRFDEGKIRRNILRMLSSRRNLSPVHSRVFDPYHKEIITKNPLTTPLEETNPLQLIGQQRRITHMGPGGIGSDDAVTPDMQMVQASEFGYYSPLEGPECFDDKSEVYTLRGWTPWTEVLDDDIFACRVEGRLEWHRAERIVRERYRGELIVGEHETIRMAITPTHRVINTRDIKYRIDLAEEVYGRSVKIPIRHEPYEGNKKMTKFSLPVIAKTNSNQRNYKAFDIVDWCAFVGWWLSEGNSSSSTRLSSGGSAYTASYIAITQCPKANPENYKELTTLLERMKLRGPGCDASSKRLSMSGKQLTDYFSQWSEGCYNKWIPEDLFEAPIKAREALLDALLKGDGRYTKKRWCYCTVSERLAKSVERLAVSLGYTAFIRIEKDFRPEVTTTNFIVSIHRQLHRQLMNRVYNDLRYGTSYGGNWSKESYDGIVYCATVPGGLLHVRGKKSTSGFWSGNSARAGVDVRLAWGAKIGRDGRMRRPLLNRRTGLMEDVSPDQLYDKFLKLPD